MKVASYFLCAGGAVVLGFGLATNACANGGATTGVSVQSVNPLLLGNVVAAASGITVFFVDETSGAVTASSGAGVRTSTGSARGLVTLACGTDSDCSNKNVRVRVGSIASTSGRAGTLSNFDIQINSGALASGQSNPPIRGNPVDFTLQPIGRNSTAAFYVGANVPIYGDDSGKSTTSTKAAYYVYVAFSGTTPSTGSTGGLATATVTRGLGLSLSGTLSFGTLLRPSTSGVVDVDPDQGAYHNTNVIATGNPPPSRVVFTATGEPNKVMSVSIPHDFNMTNAHGATLNVVVSSNAGGSETLSSSGSYTFGVGGSINLYSTTQSGAYKGTFIVSVSYN